MCFKVKAVKNIKSQIRKYLHGLKMADKGKSNHS